MRVPADRWIDPATSLTVGGVRFDPQPVGPSHTPEDLVVYLPGQRILFAGNLVFRSPIPFVARAAMPMDSPSVGYVWMVLSMSTASVKAFCLTR